MIPISLSEALKLSEIEGCTVAPVHGEFLSPDKERVPDFVVPDAFEAQSQFPHTGSKRSVNYSVRTLDQARLEFPPGHRFRTALRPVLADDLRLFLAGFALRIREWTWPANEGC